MESYCTVHKLGFIPYDQAWQLQQRLAAEIAAGARPPTLLLLQHPHTYTFGRRGDADNLLWDDEELTRREISVYWVDRGGDVTYHGPGQLVGYPLIPLAACGLVIQNPEETAGNVSTRIPQADYVGYIRKLESSLISALAKLGVVSGQLEGLTGVWVQPHVPSRCLHCPPELRSAPAKIAAIGLKVDVKGISRHGFALNIDPDMSYWEGIVGCGLGDYPVTCLAEVLDPIPTLDTVMNVVAESFGQALDYEMIIKPLENR